MSQETMQYPIDSLFYELGIYASHLPSKASMALQRTEDTSAWPLISVCVVIPENEPETTIRFLEALAAQTCTHWELCAMVPRAEERRIIREFFNAMQAPCGKLKVIVTHAQSTAHLLNSAVSHATGAYLMFPSIEDRLMPDAIYNYEDYLRQDQKNLLYTDHLSKDEENHIISSYKPDYAPDYLNSYDYIDAAFVISTKDFNDLGGFTDSLGSALRYDLLLRASESFVFSHAAMVTLVMPFSPDENDEWTEDEQADYLRAARNHLERMGVEASVELGSSPKTLRVRYAIENNPLVSIIIPTKDHREDLKELLESLESTDYQNYEIVLVENNSTEPETFEYYHTLEASYANLTIAEHKGSFNFSSIINEGCAQAKGDYYLLLNNDTCVINPGWLRELLSLGMQPGIGAVGAMLYYPNDTIQHAGILIDDNGDAWHVYRQAERGLGGYGNRLSTVQDYLAVTGACMLTPAKLFDSLGGLDEEYAVAYNDVDYCLRLHESGYRIVWSPFAELYHYEEKTRLHDDTPEKQKRFSDEKERFRSAHTTSTTTDHYYNPSLTLAGAFFLRNDLTSLYEPSLSLQEINAQHDLSMRALEKKRHHASETLKRPLKAIWHRLPHSVKRAVRLKMRGQHGKEINGIECIEGLQPYKPSLYPSGINLYGLFSTYVGIGQAAKLYNDAIDKAGIDHALIDMPLSWMSNLNHGDNSVSTQLVDRPLYNVSMIQLNPDNLYPAIDEMGQGELDGRYRIGSWVWELEDLPAEWGGAFQAFDEIWTPSWFVFDAVKKTSPVPVIHIPYCIEAPVADGVSRANFGLPEDKFLVLFMYDTGSSSMRKNPQGVIDAFFEAFGHDYEDTMLVLKARAMSTEEHDKLFASMPDPSRVKLLSDDYDKPELNALIACCDVFMSLHRSEGFGLTLGEAMALGIPVVATGWSGNMDFMNAQNSCPVKYDLKSIDHYYLYDIKSRWADPDVHDAAHYLRMLHDDPVAYDRISSAGKEFVEKNLSVAAVGELIRRRFEKISTFSRGRDDTQSFLSRLDPPQPFERTTYPDGVNLFGFFEAENGLAQGARLYAAAMDAAGINPALVNGDKMPFLKLTKNDRTYSDRLAVAPVDNINVFCLNSPEYMCLYRDMPQEYFDKRYNIGVWLWELEEFPPVWIEGLKYVDELWAPSRFIREAAIKATDLPVVVMPYGIEPICDPDCDRARFGLPQDDFLILCMYDTNSYIGRKNPQASIEAFFKAFGRKNQGVQLVLKIREPSEEDLRNIRSTLGECDNVILFGENLSREATNSLMSCCDVYVSLHRSEGFGLTMAEAMYLGVPTIATNWSANTDFMNPDVACMVDYTFVPTGDAYLETLPGARWADADVDQAAEYMKLLYEDKDAYRHFSEAGSAFIKNHFSPLVSGERMKHRIEEILNQLENRAD